MPLVVDPTGNDLTFKIIGAAMAVHNEIGHGFKEEVYEKGECQVHCVNGKGSRWQGDLQSGSPIG
jgi:hypothetical protein